MSVCRCTHIYTLWCEEDSGGRVYLGREEYFITDNVYNYKNIVIINAGLTFIGFIIVFNSLMTTCT